MARGVEDPRIVESEDGMYVLTYTQWNRRIPRLAVATSRDLVSWTKHGPRIRPQGQREAPQPESKSGLSLRGPKGNRVIATRLHGKY